MPSGWLAGWFLLVLFFCKGLFPVPPAPPETGIRWPTPIGGSCDGGMLRLNLFPLTPDSAARSRKEPFYQTPAELDSIRPWHEVEFTGRSLLDFMAFEQTIQLVKVIQADTSHAGGVRIRFQRHATFSSLVAVLDALNILNQQHYWLNVKYEPLTLYVITNEPTPGAEKPLRPLLL